MSKKNKPANTNPPPEGSRWERAKNSWEYRVGKILLRITGVMFFLCYLSFAVLYGSQWVMQTWMRGQPASMLLEVAEKSLRKSEPLTLVRWIGQRKEFEREDIMRTLEPHTGVLGSILFLTYSEWMLEQKKYDEAVFWRQYARYRLRFDALRCGAVNSVDNMDGILSLLPEGGVQIILDYKPEMLPDVLQQVLDYDAKYPARNNPRAICEIIQSLEKGHFRMVGEDRWQMMRHTLRFTTERAIEDMRKEMNAPKPDAPTEAPVEEAQTPEPTGIEEQAPTP